ncbi:MAG: bifunctional phosphopantothenoylcysteine decarboxylase/phosphopantothenate--cysteine ligase CoaBC [Aggregatilineales bacterium]
MEKISILQGKRIVLGATGSIAVYKVIDLASKLTQAGALVDVIMTDSAQRFVTPLAFQAVTGRAVYTDMWQTDGGSGLPTHIAHVGLGEGADLLAIIPATANTLAKLAAGLSDNLITVMALASRAPLLIAPAMDGGMYEHPATQANVTLLQERGAYLIDPETGRFASGLIGKGRLPETATLIGEIRRVIGQHTGALVGRKIVVSAGGTREALDPVRYITNHSSGKQGYAIAQAAIDAGADVTLISTVKNLPVPTGATLIPVDTALQMQAAVLEQSTDADALVMAAAVSDYRPATVADQKIKKKVDSDDAFSLALARNPDILLSVKQQRESMNFPHVVVGFAAESENLIANAQSKLQRKGLDFLVANDITATDAGFATDTNRVIVLHRDGTQIEPGLISKAAVGELIMQQIARALE